jgi:hypothetical protein
MKPRFNMQYQQLDKIKSQHPSFRNLIDKLANYLDAELAEGRERIIPSLTAQHLGLSDAETLALLKLFDDAGLVRAAYDVVCDKTKIVLSTVHSKSELKDLFPIPCEFCGSEHQPDDVTIELVFEITPQARQKDAVA